MKKIINDKAEKIRIFITFSILGILLFISCFWLIIKTDEVQGAWYNQDWLYRKQIIITTDGNAYNNLSVLITENTQSLITAGKLQQNCNDIRFTDSDGQTELNYWIEGGCNSINTHIWVNIPTMPTTNKYIYMYYGNNNATSGQMTWTGSFILLSDSQCSNGWSANSAFYNRFPYGSSTYGSLGGGGSHNHNGSITLTTGTPNYTTYARDYGTGRGSAATENHTHTGTASISSVTISPPYLSMIFCSKSELYNINGLIALFDSTNLPSGNWTRYSNLDSKFPFGSSTYGSTGGSTTHSHTVSSGTTSYQSAMVAVNYGFGDWNPQNTNARYGHTHSFSTSCTTVNHMPPYITMIYAKHDNSEDLSINKIVTMATNLPPLGWDSFSALNQKFPLGGSSYGTTGGNSSHTHGITITTGAASVSYVIDGGNGEGYVSRGDHSHYSNSTNSPSASNLPSYISVLFIKRRSSLATAILSEEIQNFAPDSPTNLLTNEEINNKNVNYSTNPFFSAKFSDQNGNDTGTYYEIHVNTSQDFNGTVMWNSGKTPIGPILNNNQSPNINYNGSPLGSGITYYWRIRFWDNNDAVGNWSLTASFITSRQPFPPSSLLVDGQTNPSILLSPTPAFTAIYSDVNEHNAIYYQIQVNSNNSFNGNVIWDSGKQSTLVSNGTRSPDYIYNGIQLIGSGNTYYWRIRFWDYDNQIGDWSDTAYFIDDFNHQYFDGIQMNGIRLD